MHAREQLVQGNEASTTAPPTSAGSSRRRRSDAPSSASRLHWASLSCGYCLLGRTFARRSANVGQRIYTTSSIAASQCKSSTSHAYITTHVLLLPTSNPLPSPDASSRAACLRAIPSAACDDVGLAAGTVGSTSNTTAMPWITSFLSSRSAVTRLSSLCVGTRNDPPGRPARAAWTPRGEWSGSGAHHDRRHVEGACNGARGAESSVQRSSNRK